MSKFNMGDKVRVVDSVYARYPDESMYPESEFVENGAEGIVESDEMNLYVPVIFPHSHKVWLFEPGELELVPQV